MAELLYRIGRFAARRRLLVIATWLSLLVVAGAAFAVGGRTPTGEITIPGTPTEQVTERLAASFPDAAGGTGTVVFQTDDGAAFTDAQKAAIGARIADAAKVAGVARVVDPFTTQAETDAQAKAMTDGRAQIATATAQLEAGQKQLDAG
jgi:putative drug exporter of the RND superfamily